MTAIPALVVARSDPLERIKHHTRELEEAMREAYGVEVETIAFPKTDDMKPMIFVVAQRLRAEDASGIDCEFGDRVDREMRSEATPLAQIKRGGLVRLAPEGSGGSA